jgi:hypothetical protein
MKTKLGLALLSSIMVIVGGCCLTPVESVLTGNWSLTLNDNTEVDWPATVLIFDTDGQISEIQFTLSGQAYATTYPDSTTTVDGSTVTIKVFTDQGTLTFVGTLSEDEQTVTGTLTTALTFGNVTITLPGVSATLTRLLT